MRAPLLTLISALKRTKSTRLFTSLTSLFHHKKPINEDDKADAEKATEARTPSQQSTTPASTETEQPTTRAPLNPDAPPNVAPQFSPATGPPAHDQMFQAEYLEVTAGGPAVWATGDELVCAWLMGRLAQS